MRYLNATQAAIEIGISYRTLRRRIDAGEIEAVKGKDGQYAIALTEVERVKALQDERPKPAMAGQGRSGQDRFEQQLADLEARVQFLEATTSRDRTLFALAAPDEPEQDSIPMPLQHKIPADLPEGTLHSTDFAEQLGIKKTVFEGMLKNGVRGQHLEREKKPSGGGRNTNYFTPEQQKKAIAILRYYGKLPEPGE